MKAYEILSSKIKDGSGLLKLRQLVQAQHGNALAIDDFSLLPKANNCIDIYAENEGYIKSIKADDIGLASLIIGAGRETKQSKIDLSAGIVLFKKVADAVKVGERIAQIHLNDMTKAEEAKKIVSNAYKIVNVKVDKPKLIKAIITKDNIEIF
jgi:pyrimidine-nucleoside phosphorylase